MTDRNPETTHEEVEAAYGLGSAEWIAAVKAEVTRLRAFIQSVADAPDAMVCRLTRDAAKEVLND